ncbi:MAG TPA: response regulator [Stellaceae bacterium]|nr:response regulator [Stellaceae bacterium]
MPRTSASKRICRVLVVEDNSDIRDLLSDVFAAEGYHFAAVASGAEMRQAIAKDPIDVVVIDVSLPGGEDGYSLAVHAADCGLGVVLVTGHHDHFERLEKSGHNYLLKPFPMKSLLEAVDRALQKVKADCVVSAPR